MLSIPLSYKIKTKLVSDKGDPIYKNYYPPPIITESNYIYQDINNNHDLRASIVNFYNQKLFRWINTKEKLFHLKNNDYIINNSKDLLYKIIRKFVKKYDINWYDLIDSYDLIKYYIIDNIIEYIDNKK